MNKRIFDLIFIVVSAAMLIVLAEYGLLEKHIGFSLLPILVAYQIGQYTERKFKK
jgi:hypothetical protein